MAVHVTHHPRTSHDLMNDLEQTRSLERLMVRARWVAVAFAALQVTLYSAETYPPGYHLAAYVIVAGLALANLVIAYGTTRTTTLAEAKRLSVFALSTDVLFASGIVWLYAFDATSALFAVLFVLPVEGALRFQLRGAMWTWAASAALYVGREFWASVAHGHPVQPESITFRMGLVGILAYIVGGMARNLHESLRTTRSLERWRSDLISVLAHDVRAPVATAISSLELLRHRRSDLDQLTYERIVEGARHSLNNVERLARDLLDMARAESGRLDIVREPTEIMGLIRDAVRSAAGPSAEFVTLEGPPEIATHVDPHRFEQIVTNLVTNALRHGQPPVRIAVGSEGDTLQVEVIDRGPGSAASEVDQLFQRFSNPGRQGSVGLGLWIVRQLVEAHGGEVHYERRQDASCFQITLPSAVAGDRESAQETSS